jgi:hypothetical protein
LSNVVNNIICLKMLLVGFPLSFGPVTFRHRWLNYAVTILFGI